MAKKEKPVTEKIKFEYTSEFSIDEYKFLRTHSNLPELSDNQLEFIFTNNNWRYCCKIDNAIIAMCRFLCDEASTLIITDVVVHSAWRDEKAKIPERLIGGVVDYVKSVLQPNEELQVILLNMDTWTKEQLKKLGYKLASDVLFSIVN
ncbi:MAG: hypothetical protein IJ361_05445 [Spirochaetaceae bacterium]|nr:hypothetical protein [Spirochaetaceae bacterium]